MFSLKVSVNIHTYSCFNQICSALAAVETFEVRKRKRDSRFQLIRDICYARNVAINEGQRESFPWTRIWNQIKWVGVQMEEHQDDGDDDKRTKYIYGPFFCFIDRTLNKGDHPTNPSMPTSTTHIYIRSDIILVRRPANSIHI